ncbi:LytTR family DNA-binding domain-containing protein [Clostridium tagluense]|uniref:LytR/AlgR family response regulator transcription factor n=1 Tax=Clostridium tagluense TaxID=360422 RepID=UPI001C0D86AA|nr:LytTR family DNA-binding domain-containing protein [Clostridium tagluense]MBU3129929.1 LytTR family DNA-binding domain-containing protein [Clostridium tagluense]MCB2311944.1 LytTR family DNA-binding domain-containing protein [Clostridium tagluense]MCB2318145.1 LytTR family DNA-binding domain-containing protein [Clostridium tagluense]MCB2323318.1 LytTR family DNA-binding domain-containing protein [Clostridium tagluense]MCB2327929.1 LytTR family DNA-binding domain-containing protein [Clostrid
MINILICDDCSKTLQLIKNIVIKTYEEEMNFKDFNVLTFINSADLISYVTNSFEKNIYILDIDLNEEKNGLKLGREIRKLDQYSGEMIFVTNHVELSFKVFQYKLRVVTFINKSLDLESQLKESLLVATEILNKQKDEKQKKLIIKIGTEIFKIPSQEIIYIETIKNSRKVILYSTHTMVEFYSTLKELMNSLDDNFIQIHKTSIVNKKYIKNVCKNSNNPYVEMTTGAICSISRTGLKEVSKACG